MEVELVVGDITVKVVQLIALQHTLIAVVVERGIILHLLRASTDADTCTMVDAAFFEQDVVPVVGGICPRGILSQLSWVQKNRK